MISPSILDLDFPRCFIFYFFKGLSITTIICNYLRLSIKTLELLKKVVLCGWFGFPNDRLAQKIENLLGCINVFGL